VNTPGTLTVGGNLTLDSAYESVFDLTNSTAVGGGTNDLVVVTGDLDAGLGTIRINPLAPLVSGTYRLMEYTGTETLPFSGGVVGLNTRDTATLDETTPGQVNLIVTAGAAQELAWNPGGGRELGLRDAELAGCGDAVGDGAVLRPGHGAVR
jgi:fibronectin-binding autotransporter adhesin